MAFQLMFYVYAFSKNFCRDGLPYCEKDYQRQFGVKCDHCERFIAGKVLQVTKQSRLTSIDVYWNE